VWWLGDESEHDGADEESQRRGGEAALSKSSAARGKAARRVAAEVASRRCRDRRARRGSCRTTHGEACRGKNEMERLGKGNAVAARIESW
jgi:hypothetical protein